MNLEKEHGNYIKKGCLINLWLRFESIQCRHFFEPVLELRRWRKTKRSDYKVTKFNAFLSLL